MEEELRVLARLFERYPRPSTLTNVEHCSECAEHHEAQGNGDDYDLTQFLSHVARRRDLFSSEQRLAVAAFLLQAGVVLADEIARNGDEHELANVLALWWSDATLQPTPTRAT